MSSTSKGKSKKRCDACDRKMKGGGVQFKFENGQKFRVCPEDWAEIVNGLDADVLVEIFSKEWVKI